MQLLSTKYAKQEVKVCYCYYNKDYYYSILWCIKTRVLPDHPRCRSTTWICVCGHTRDIIFKVSLKSIQDYWATLGQNLAICISLAFTIRNKKAYYVGSWRVNVQSYDPEHSIFELCSLILPPKHLFSIDP